MSAEFRKEGQAATLDCIRLCSLCLPQLSPAVAHPTALLTVYEDAQRQRHAPSLVHLLADLVVGGHLRASKWAAVAAMLAGNIRELAQKGLVHTSLPMTAHLSQCAPRPAALAM